MMNFLKNFLSGEKTAEEKAMAMGGKKRDVLDVGYKEKQKSSGCDSNNDAEEEYTGCGGCGCRR